MGFFTPKDWREPYRRLSDGELLDRIREGDEPARNYLWVTYHDAVLLLVQPDLNRYGNPEQLGQPGDFVRDAMLLLLEKASRLGAGALKVYSNIKGWLKNTAFNFIRSTSRKDRHIDRTEPTTTDDEEPRSKVDSVEDEGADAFGNLPQKDRDTVIREVMASLPKELQTLIRAKFMDGHSWKETSELMVRLYPDHDPPFELSYLQKTYWDRVHKKPFIKKLGDNLDL